MKNAKPCVFRNKAAGDRLAALHRKQFDLGLDGQPRRRSEAAKKGWMNRRAKGLT